MAAAAAEGPRSSALHAVLLADMVVVCTCELRGIVPAFSRMYAVSAWAAGLGGVGTEAMFG
jgi:hypothetical protein